MRRGVLFAALALAACNQAGEPAPQPSETAAPTAAAPALPEPGEVKLPPQVADFPALESRDCREVARFYLDAVAARAFDKAALVWSDPVIDGARLAALFGGYAKPQIAIGELTTEGAAGSLYCTVNGTLTDSADLAKPPVGGELVLKRVNDVDGANPEQLRWTLRSSTFVETLERSARS